MRRPGSPANPAFFALVALLLSSAACSRQPLSTPSDAEAIAPGPLAVRVPAALMISRALDALSVSVDPASLALTHVTTDAGMVVGVEREVFVFARGLARPATGRRSVVPSADFTVGTDTWTTKADGIPVPGTEYVVEVSFVLFEADTPPAHGWDPHAGNYKALWSRTLRQAEE